jgi:hypothetical protein
LPVSQSIARWLGDIGFPVVEPLPVEQPIVGDGYAVTLWRYLPRFDEAFIEFVADQIPVASRHARICSSWADAVACVFQVGYPNLRLRCFLGSPPQLPETGADRSGKH